MLEERKRTLTLSPSFREEDEEEDEGDRAISAAHHGSPQQISAVPALPGDSRGEVGGGSGDDDDFEFSFAIAAPDSAAPAITADEIFSNGRIRPVYPVFDRSLLLGDDDDDADPPPPSSSAAAAATAGPRPGARLPLGRLLMEERNSSVGSNSSSSSSAASEPGELEGVAPETYCLWTPGSAPNSPARCRKSGSTGSIVRWRRISDLVIGRSRSDGKEKFLFLRNPNPNPNPNPSPEPKAKEAKEAKEAKGKERKGGKVTEMDTVTAHRVLYYGKGAKGGRRASFLPYKQDLVGIFANVNGVSRAHHPL
ncbi:uncharacterized protein LOC109716919 [Ananas comosus]|uniref:Uncharacterized protein LOC109716919 n=1 Tax=Ananas comosus TaxID=4615 RepID=A0A6P5FX95_ANACO|nr:uncharacterized protein LOC109716919 [Ananas comosus]